MDGYYRRMIDGNGWRYLYIYPLAISPSACFSDRLFCLPTEVERLEGYDEVEGNRGTLQALIEDASACINMDLGFG
jgi:hypothetical protein